MNHNKKTSIVIRVYIYSNDWCLVRYVKTLNEVFSLTGPLISPDTAHGLIRLVAEHSYDDDDKFRRFVVETYISLFKAFLGGQSGKINLPDVLLQVLLYINNNVRQYLSEIQWMIFCSIRTKREHGDRHTMIHQPI